MTCTIEATAGSATANAYADLTEADLYHLEERLEDADWTGASNTTKCRALKWATRLMDEQLTWTGEVATDEQALAWPRTGAFDHLGRAIGSDVIPQRLKNATAELARNLIEGDTTEDLSSEGILKLKVASIEVAFDEANPPERRVIPDAVMQMLGPMVESSRFSSGGTVKLVRT